MKSSEFLSDFKSKKKELKVLSEKIMKTRMVMDNIKDLFSDKWVIENFYGSPGIRIRPADGITIRVNDFDKFVAKLAKIFRCKPYLDVNQSYVVANFYSYVSNGDKLQRFGINIEISTVNTESCDFEEVEETITRKKLTGYCKALAEKQYQLS